MLVNQIYSGCGQKIDFFSFFIILYEFYKTTQLIDQSRKQLLQPYYLVGRSNRQDWINFIGDLNNFKPSKII